MPDLIEPNIHPVLVHFTYALFTVGALSLLFVALAPAGGRADSLRHAGDWMIFFGAVAAVATVAAGFQAYYSVDHDAPSHAAMTTHRNWAIPTAAALLAFAGWRYWKRKSKPGVLFAALFVAAIGLLSVTAWWGGRLVYHYGIGVRALPVSEGPGHAHAHVPGEDHGGEPAQTAAAPLADPETPAGAVDAFAAALKAGDAATIKRLLLPDVLIAEGGGAERSFAEYAGHHLPADMAFAKAVVFTVKDRKVIDGADMATVVSTSQAHGEFRGETVHSAMMETMVLKRVDGAWRIAHIHWSSAPIKGEHEH
jgi:uncharacterized membrane protein/ketosteroid isomerase-like protein